uniref:Chaperone protein dnaJ 8, chloroplastic n=1 Tax=Anthurium amnicola TaxID=1678845 RepID=A0A1D1YLR7_9ARAE
MAMAVGMVGSCGASGSPVASRAGGGVHRCGRGRKAGRGSPRRLVCSAASASSPCYTAGLTEQYRTLRIQPGASEKEVKKAFRQLALQVGVGVSFPFCDPFPLPLSLQPISDFSPSR